MGDREWDETLFAGAVSYEQGRLPYAPGLVQLLAEVLPVDGQGRLLDVGCGPGSAALALAQLFRESVGVDPDPGMLAAARRRAALTPAAGRTRWVGIRAEDLLDGLGTFTVAVFAQSFHRMDREKVAQTAHGMLRPGGALVHVSDLKTRSRTVDGLPYPPVPYVDIGVLVKRYLGPSDVPAEACFPRAHPEARRRCSTVPDFWDPSVTSSRAGRASCAPWTTSSPGRSRCPPLRLTCSARTAGPSRRTCGGCSPGRLRPAASPSGSQHRGVRVAHSLSNCGVRAACALIPPQAAPARRRLPCGRRAPCRARGPGVGDGAAPLALAPPSARAPRRGQPLTLAVPVSRWPVKRRDQEASESTVTVKSYQPCV
nr:methyltransferase domain-containing protein [Streptomyces sp. MUSC 125]